MANIKISEMDAAATLDGSELVEIVQGGANVQTTTQDIADLGGGGGVTVSPQSGNFTADGVSGTTYTDEGSSGMIVATLEDSAIGTIYTFANYAGNGIRVQTPAGNQIVFWDAPNIETQTVDTDGDGSFLDMPAAGMSCTICRVTTSTWIATAINGAYYDN